jgi:hypothetical protein
VIACPDGKLALSAGLRSAGAASPEEGMTVSDALLVVPPLEAVIVATVDVVTVCVRTVKVALVAPAGTVTPAGTLVALELSESATAVPPGGAGALIVTVPVEELPPTTLVGLTDIPESTGPACAGITVIDENSNTLSRAAESCTVVVSCGNVVTVKVALVAPPGTVTLAGTPAASG